MFFGFSKRRKNVKKRSHLVMHAAFNYSITRSRYRLVTVTNIKHLAQKCGHKKLYRYATENCEINAYRLST